MTRRTDPSTPPDPLRRFDATGATLARLQEVDELVRRYRAAHTARQIPVNTLEALRVELTYHSNAIEGNTLSLRETQMIVEGRTPSSGKPLREIYEARNHDRALRLIEIWARTRRDQALTDHDLLEVHRTVMADIDDRIAGRFRSGRVLISGTGYVPPGSHRFDELIPALLDLAGQPDVHPVVQATEVHYNLAAVHPFEDGNGRTARLLMNHHLLRNDFPFAIIEIHRRGEYLAALDEANHGRLEPLVDVVLEGVRHSATRILG